MGCEMGSHGVLIEALLVPPSRVPHSSSPQLVQVAQANHRAEANYESVPYSACLQVAPIEVGHKELVNG